MSTQIARRFALAGHPVALLARQRSRLDSLAEQINSLKAGPAQVFDADASQKQSVDAVFGEIDRYYQGTATSAKVWGAIYNPGGFAMSPLLDVSETQLRQLVDVQFFGAFFFAQAFLRSLTKSEDPSAVPSSNDAEARGFLAFTGASASLKGSKNFAAFSAAKGALRNFAQATAREWQPLGVHVFHPIIDGFIDTEATREQLGTDVSTGREAEYKATSRAASIVACNERLTSSTPYLFVAYSSSRILESIPQTSQKLTIPRQLNPDLLGLMSST